MDGGIRNTKRKRGHKGESVAKSNRTKDCGDL